MVKKGYVSRGPYGQKVDKEGVFYCVRWRDIEKVGLVVGGRLFFIRDILTFLVSEQQSCF